MRTHHVECARTYPVATETAYDLVLSAALPRVFSRRYGPLPPVRAVTGQAGAWGTAGQTRTIHLAGGGSMHEELTEAERSSHFAYRVSDITGPMWALASGIDGRWVFEPAGTGVRISWSWELHPRTSGSARTLPVVGWFWQGYSRQALEQIEDLLVPRV